MDGAQGSRGTASTKTFKKRVARLYFGGEDGILELQRKHPELFKAAGPSEHGVSCRVVADSSPVTGEVMKPDKQHTDDVIIESQKNYIYSDNLVESDAIVDEDDLKLWLNNVLARLKAEEEESLRISTQLHAEGIAVSCLQLTYIEEVDGGSEITREQLLMDEKMILNDVKKYLKPTGTSTDTSSDTCAGVHYVHICDGCKPSTPLVMLHGIGGVIPAFHMLFSEQTSDGQHLFTDRCVYSIDIPGFGLSQGLKFVDEIRANESYEDIANKCEKKMLQYIEKWRVEMKIDKMILFGHSFGGYISAAYAAQFPEHVEQLVLMEPWGIFSSKENNSICEDLCTVTGMLKRCCSCFEIDPFQWFSIVGHQIGMLIVMLLFIKEREVWKLYMKERCLDYIVSVHQKGEQFGLNAFCYISGFSFDYSITTTPIKERLSALVKKHPRIGVLFLLGEKTCANDQNPCQDSQDLWFQELRACSNLIKEKVANSGHHPNVESPKEVVKLIFKHVYNQ